MFKHAFAFGFAGAVGAIVGVSGVIFGTGYIGYKLSMWQAEQEKKNVKLASVSDLDSKSPEPDGVDSGTTSTEET